MSSLNLNHENGTSGLDLTHQLPYFREKEEVFSFRDQVDDFSTNLQVSQLRVEGRVDFCSAAQYCGEGLQAMGDNQPVFLH